MHRAAGGIKMAVWGIWAKEPRYELVHDRGEACPPPYSVPEETFPTPYM